MKVLLAAAVMSLLGALAAQAGDTKVGLANPARCATGAISRVSTRAATCCGMLPCQRPLSFETVSPPRHAAHT